MLFVNESVLENIPIAVSVWMLRGAYIDVAGFVFPAAALPSRITWAFRAVRDAVALGVAHKVSSVLISSDAGYAHFLGSLFTAAFAEAGRLFPSRRRLFVITFDSHKGGLYHSY